MGFSLLKDKTYLEEWTQLQKKRCKEKLKMPLFRNVTCVNNNIHMEIDLYISDDTIEIRPQNLGTIILREQDLNGYSPQNPTIRLAMMGREPYFFTFGSPQDFNNAEVLIGRIISEDNNIFQTPPTRDEENNHE